MNPIRGNTTMRLALAAFQLGLVACLVAAVGCAHHDAAFSDVDLQRYIALTEIEYPDVEEPVIEETAAVDPRSVIEGADAEYWDLSLSDAIHLAMERAQVMRDLGAGVLRLPEGVETLYGPALQESDPRFGVEAALSEFDAMFRGNVSAEKNDRRLNNQVFGLRGFLDQELVRADAELSKRSVVGSRFSVRHGIAYDENNAPTNECPSSWDTFLEAEARQPLAQGAGVAFNRLAGPNSQPGAANGVLIARTRTDISLADFEIRVRDFLSNVENAYWDLYFAYRDLDSKIMVRDASLQTWNYVNANVRRLNFGAAKEAQAREQYFRFQQDVVNSLAGRPVDRTQGNNGSRPGTFQAVPGVRAAERRLRLMLGIPVSDYQLIRPSDEPPIAPVVYDWDTVVTDSLGRRAELRRQRWQVKKRELELLASRNYLLPQVDLVGRYRWRGFGNDLARASGNSPTRFDNAYEDLTTGDFQEWQVGLEVSAPVGFRKAHAAVRNAELQLAREKAILEEQQRQVIHDLSSAVAEMERALESYHVGYDRLMASQQQVKALKAASEADQAELDVVLDAQRRYAASLSNYHQSKVEYAVSLKNVHFEKGTLLEYCGVYLAEGTWQPKARNDAAELDYWRSQPLQPKRVANPPLTISPLGPSYTIDTVAPAMPEEPAAVPGALPVPENNAPQDASQDIPSPPLPEPWPAAPLPVPLPAADEPF